MLTNAYRRGKIKFGKIYVHQAILLALCAMPLLILGGFIIYNIASLAVSNSIIAETATVIIASAQVMVFVFALSTLIGSLSMARDSKLIATLPLKKTAVFFARFTKVYLSELALSAYLLVPMLCVYGVGVSHAGYSLSFAYYIAILFIVIVSPLLPLAIASIIIIPVMRLTRFIRLRTTFSTLALLAVVFLIMLLYFVFIPNFISLSNLESLSSSAVVSITQTAGILYPDFVMVNTAIGVNSWVNLGISTAVVVGLFAFIFGLALLLYSQSQNIDETGIKSKSSETKEEKRRSLFASLFITDIKNIFRSPFMAFSTLSSALITPIMGAVYNMGVVAGDIAESMILASVFLMLTILLSGSANFLSIWAFTRDGKSHFMTRSLPIPAKTAVGAKFLLALICNMIIGILLIVMNLAFSILDVVSAVLIPIVTVLFSAGINALEIRADMKDPSLDWTDFEEMKKRGFKGLVPMVLGFVGGAIFILIAVFISFFQSSLGDAGMIALFWGIVTVVSIASSAGLVYTLFSKADELYNDMEERARVNAKANANRIKMATTGKSLFISSKDKGGMLK